MFLLNNLLTRRKDISIEYLQGSVFNGQGYILIIILFSVAYNIIKFFEFETVMIEVEDEITGEK